MGLGGFAKFAGGALSVFGAVVSFVPGLQWLGIGMMVAGGVLSAAASAPNQPKERKPANYHQINTRSSRAPLPLIYGVCRVGVNKTYYHLQNPYLWIVCEICEGQITGIEREDGTYYTTTDDVIPSTNPPLIYFDEKLWTEYGASNVTMYYYNGAITQNVCAALQTASGGKWDQTLRRTAYLVVRLTFDIDYFKQEPDITVKVRGLTVYDPIAATWDYRNNAATVAYDLLTRGSQRGGLGVGRGRIDSTSFEAARDYCTAKGWVFNAPITEQQAAADNLELILACYRGAIVYSENKFKFTFADLNYNAVSLALTEDDIVEGSLRIEMPDISDRPNAVNATYIDEEKLYRQNDLTVTDQAAIAAEGDYRELKVTLLGLNNATLAGKMANYILERERLRKMVSFTAGERCVRLEPMDVLTLTHSTPGWNAHYLRVNAISVNPDHTVNVSCYDDAFTLYDDVYNLTDQDYNSTTLLDPNAEPPEVESISLAEETYVFRLRTASRLNCTFSPPSNYPWFAHVEVWVSKDAATWTHQFNSTDDFSIDPVEEGQTYYIKLVTVNVFGTKMDFETAPVHTLSIDGKRATAPSSLTSITAVYTGSAVNVYGDKVSDPDVEVYEFRLGATWGTGLFLGALRAPNLSLNGIKPGTHTFWANTLGANGVYGDTPRSAIAVVPDPPTKYTVVETLAGNSNLLTVGDMETTGGWSDWGSPATNAVSTVYAHSGSYSRKFVPVLSTGGIQSDAFTVANSAVYAAGFWTYINRTTYDSGALRIALKSGDGSPAISFSSVRSIPTNQWVYITKTFTATAAGSSGAFIISGAADSTIYIDDAAVIRISASGTSTNAGPTLYNSSLYLQAAHGATASTDSTVYTGTLYTQLATATTQLTGYAYSSFDHTVLGAGGNWSDVFPASTMRWNEEFTASTATWNSIISPAAAPNIKMALQYGATNAVTSTLDNFHIMGGVVTDAKYFRLKIQFEDPSYNVFGLVSMPTIKIAT